MNLKTHEEIKLNYTTSGEGMPLILLHGFGENIFAWRFLLPAIPEGYKTYVIDLKGFGGSPKPPDGRYSMQDQSDLIVSFIRERALQQVTLIGHSMGGGIALLTAIRLQDLGNPPSSLVLIDSMAYPQRLPPVIRVLRSALLRYAMSSIFSVETQVRLALKEVYYRDSKVPEDAVEAYSRPLREPGGYQALVSTAQQITPPNVSDFTTRIGELKAPTLIIWGRHDVLVPLAVGKKLKESLQNSELRVIEMAGHVPHQEVPELCLDMIVTFLRDHAR